MDGNGEYPQIATVYKENDGKPLDLGVPTICVLGFYQRMKQAYPARVQAAEAESLP